MVEGCPWCQGSPMFRLRWPTCPSLSGTVPVFNMKVLHPGHPLNPSKAWWPVTLQDPCSAEGYLLFVGAWTVRRWGFGGEAWAEGRGPEGLGTVRAGLTILLHFCTPLGSSRHAPRPGGSRGPSGGSGSYFGESSGLDPEDWGVQVPELSPCGPALGGSASSPTALRGANCGLLHAPCGGRGRLP